MKESLYLAYRYLTYNRIKSIVMILSLTILVSLPVCLNLLVAKSENYLMKRALDTPLVIGEKGSSLDLVINTLYFEDTEIQDFNYGELTRINETGFAVPVPLHTKFSSNRFPIVGTSLEYFEFRGLEISAGNMFAMMGECVIGVDVAQKLGVKTGEYIISSPETALDITGVYPLRMKISGVLKRTYSPDDNVIFTDIKTTWVIEGLVHGHQDIESSGDNTILLGVKDNNYIANSKLYNYNEITPENVSEFHIHGNKDNFPVSSIIALPYTAKDEALLMGRYLEKKGNLNALIPEDVVSKLIDNIFRFQKLFEGIFVFTAFALLLLLALVITLSLRLRSGEIQTMFKLGSSRSKIFEIITFELVILAVASLMLSCIIIYIAYLNTENFINLVVF